MQRPTSRVQNRGRSKPTDDGPWDCVGPPIPPVATNGRWGSLNFGVSTPNGWTFFLRTAQRSADETQGPQDARRSPKLARLEAVLLTADGALSARRLVQLAILADAAEARTLIDRLNATYDAAGSAFRVEEVATGYQLLTRPQLAPWLNKLHHRPNKLKLSAPAMETLTIIAYRQPMTRGDVEAIRGVQCTEILKQLMDRGLVRIAGHDDSLGRPYLYETTRKFLELFGLRKLDDLPLADQMRPRKPDSKEASQPTAGGADQDTPPANVSEKNPSEP